MEPLLTTEDVGDFLRVDVVTVRRLVNKGDLVAYRVGSEFRFAHDDLDEFLRRQRVSGRSSEIDVQSERFAKLTDRAHLVIVFARDEAVRLNHSYIGTEHLLLGLVREGEGVAGFVLHRLGVDLVQIRERVEFIIRRRVPEENLASTLKATAKETADVLIGKKPYESLGLTPRARKVIELAIEEAQRLDHVKTGTEHLLLGMLREGEGIASRVLDEMGLSLDYVRDVTLNFLNTMTKKQAEETASPLAIPEEASVLVPEGTEARDCVICSARNPLYFRFCFNCGRQLAGA